MWNRFENFIDANNYSFGLTLNQFEIYTINEDGKKVFIDRTIE